MAFSNITNERHSTSQPFLLKYYQKKKKSQDECLPFLQTTKANRSILEFAFQELLFALSNVLHTCLF